MGVFQHVADDEVQVLPGLDALSQEAYVAAVRVEFGPCGRRVISKHRDRIIAIQPSDACRAFDAIEADALFDHGTNLQQMVVDIVARLVKANSARGSQPVGLPPNVSTMPIRAARAGMSFEVTNTNYVVVLADYTDTYYDLAFKSRGKTSITYATGGHHCGDNFAGNVQLHDRVVQRMLVHALRVSGLRKDRSGWIYVSSYNNRPLTQFSDQRPALLLVGSDALYYVPIGLSQAEVQGNSLCFVCKVSLSGSTLTVDSLAKTYSRGNITQCPPPPN